VVWSAAGSNVEQICMPHASGAGWVGDAGGDFGQQRGDVHNNQDG
jgi:hypothetical protein